MVSGGVRARGLGGLAECGSPGVVAGCGSSRGRAARRAHRLPHSRPRERFSCRAVPECLYPGFGLTPHWGAWLEQLHQAPVDVELQWALLGFVGHFGAVDLKFGVEAAWPKSVQLVACGVDLYFAMGTEADTHRAGEKQHDIPGNLFQSI